MQLSKQQFDQGRRNFQQSLGVNRRDFLRASIAVPTVGAAYFGYEKLHGAPVRAGIVGTGNEGCGAMINQSPTDYIQYVAYHDIRPTQIERGRRVFKNLYGPVEGEKVKFYDDYDKMLQDPDIEAIVIATPLWTHADLTIRALKAGKHVLCEKLMAHNIADAKEMVRVADQTGKLLSIGHQRHYSTLYADTLDTIRSGTLGDIRYIRALWHRNNAQIDPQTGKYRDSWKPPIPEKDKNVDFAKYGYKSLEELIRWRLYDRTGGGLMAELGSHQLDACSIFLSAILDHHDGEKGGKIHPIAVSAVGGQMFFDDERECEDHVYCTYEFPSVDNPEKPGIVLTYSSINTNAMEGYGEVIEGTRGTLMVMRERDVLLFDERDPLAARRKAAEEEAAKESKTTKVAVGAAGKDESTMYSAASLGLPAQAAKATTGQDVSRGYKEELEHFAFCVRNPGQNVRCDGRVGLADAVMALTTNIAMRKGQRIEFQSEWFDPASDRTPEELI